MPAATDPPQAQPLKPSRYRTIRGKNVPESRRFVEPAATATTTNSPGSGSGSQTSALTTSSSTNSNGTTSSSSGYSDLSSRRPTPVVPSVPVFHNDVRPPMPSSGLANGSGHGTGSGVTSLNGHNGSGQHSLNGSRNMAVAVRHAPPAPPAPQQYHQQQQQQLQQQKQQLSSGTATAPSSSYPSSSPSSATPADRSRHRPPPLRPTRLDTSPPESMSMSAPMHASATTQMPAPAAGATPTSAPILVPLPSARARGLVSGADQHEMLLAGNSDEVARREAEAERLLAEQKRKDLERLERELENHQSATSNLPPKSPVRDKFSFLTRRRGLSSAAPPTPTATAFATSNEPLPTRTSVSSPDSPNGPPSSRPPTSYTSSRGHSGSEPPLPSSAATTATSASSTALPPFMDAPSSAPGSGANKHIIVRCRQFSVNVPFTAETTVGDALDLATELLPRGINLAGCALIESYTRLGLERRLRRYERIKDIMGSWDTDNDNAFVVMLSEESGAAMKAASGGDRSPKEKKGLFSKSTSTPEDVGAITSSNSVGRNGHASDLDLSSVSRSKSTHPPGFIFMSMYHSQKPGRWNKRFITLVEETGQMVASKKADESRLAFLASEASNSSNNNNNNSDFQNLCHLSDYDIYTPTESQMRKHLRPPKTYCFAVKSQQRTTVFLNTDNYVHFFSTDDPAQARMFYDRIFAWRSWYLVNKHLCLPGRNATKKKKQEEEQQQQQQQQRQQIAAQASVPMPPSSSATLRKNTLQRSMSRKSASQTDNPARFSTAGSLFGGIGDFDPTLDLDRSEPVATDSRTRSLLGNNNYEERRRADSAATQASGVRDRERHHHQASSGSFKGLTAAAGAETSWFPSASEHSARQRSKSIREVTPSSSRPHSGEDIPLGLQFPQLLQQQQQQQQQQQAEREASMARSRSTRRTTGSGAAPPPLSQQLLLLQQQQAAQQQLQQSAPNMPAPLIDLTPKFQEAPQWSKEGKGHGVRAPPGTTHLVDLATDRKAQMAASMGVRQKVLGGAVPPPSNANLFRRDQAQAQAAYQSGRSQTMTSSSAAVAAAFSRSRSLAHHGGRPSRESRGDAPPVPLLQRIPGGVPLQDGAASVPMGGSGSGRERSTTLTRNQ